MIILTIVIEILFLIIGGYCSYKVEEDDSIIARILAIVLMVAIIIFPFVIGYGHGYINYFESNDRDKARITAITQEQSLVKAFYKVEVEYLTNTPTQSGVVTNYNIEKDTFYCYITDKELVEKIQSNLYKEVWLISGYKGGYNTWKDFGNKLLKDIEIIEGE